MKKSLIFFCLLILSITVSAQKKILISENDQVVEEARKEIDKTLANPESDFMKAIKVNKVTGEYVFDITIYEKGKVLSVFAVRSDNWDVKMQNLVKDLVRLLEFDFKMPKGKSYKFQYIFTFK